MKLIYVMQSKNPKGIILPPPSCQIGLSPFFMMWFCLWRSTAIMSFIYNVRNPIQVITCNKLITDQNAIIQRNISHVTWHHGEEICPDCSLPDCHIACLPKTFGGKSCESNETKNQVLCNVWFKRRIGENNFCQTRKQFEVLTVKRLVVRSTAIQRVSYLIAVLQEVLQSTQRLYSHL